MSHFSGRQPKADTCIDCIKVPDGEFCTERCLPRRMVQQQLRYQRVAEKQYLKEETV